eukprot:COSAG03_NODE_5373_length_1266_cov_1.118252_1_plen_301_part_10
MYAGRGYERGPAVVLKMLAEQIRKLALEFGVHYRFESYGELAGETGWCPLDELPLDHSLRAMWLPDGLQSDPERAPALQCDTAPDLEPAGADTAIVAWLAQFKLERYAAQLCRHGYDDVEFIRELTEADVDDLIADAQMEKGHAKRFKLECARLRHAVPNGAWFLPPTGHQPKPAPFRLPAGKQYHFFICHHQGSGGDQAMTLCERLTNRGCRVWYDNNQLADHRNVAGMRRGVRESVCVLIFLSGRKETQRKADPNGDYEGPFTRWYCHEEMAEAHRAGVGFVGVQEIQVEHDKPDIALE